MQGNNCLILLVSNLVITSDIKVTIYLPGYYGKYEKFSGLFTSYKRVKEEEDYYFNPFVCWGIKEEVSSRNKLEPYFLKIEPEEELNYRTKVVIVNLGIVNRFFISYTVESLLLDNIIYLKLIEEYSKEYK